MTPAESHMKLADFIQTRMPDLLSEWETSVRTGEHASRDLPDLALRDHAAQILSAIADDIGAQRDAAGHASGSDDAVLAFATASAVHGALREEHDVSLLHLTAEYRALRATVLKAWLPTVPSFDAERMQEIVRFNEAVDQAISESVIAYDARAARNRQQSEAALRESEERYRGIVTTALDYAIFTTDPNGFIESWPPGAQAVFGWSEEEAVGRHAEMTYIDADRAANVPENEMRGARENGVAPNVRWHVCKDGRHVFIEGAMRPLIDAAGEINGFLKVGRDATERKHWDERQQVLLGELQHRTRNLMAVVLTTFERTCRSSPDIETLSKTYKNRLAALARVQSLLSRLQEGDRIAFDTLVRAELSAMGALDETGRSERVALSGPSGVLLRSGTVQTFALALHELATNASKYGALAQEQGRLSVHWRAMRRDGAPALHIEWIESCVDMPLAASAPRGTGHGRELIEHALPYQLDARTTYEMGPDGVRCTIEVPISDATSPDVISHD